MCDITSVKILRMSKPTARVYIDGFNLYRRCLEKYPKLKWLDPVALARAIMPNYYVEHVHYFTAKIKPNASPDKQAPQRQQMYLRALDTLPDLTVTFGTFRTDKRHMIEHPVKTTFCGSFYLKTAVRKVEEKGSDVNLAAHLIFEALTLDASHYVVLTNDSDQAGALRLLKGHGVKTGIIFPMESARGSKELANTEPDFTGFVLREHLAKSQLPDRLQTPSGWVHRPPKWS